MTDVAAMFRFDTTQAPPSARESAIESEIVFHSLWNRLLGMSHYADEWAAVKSRQDRLGEKLDDPQYLDDWPVGCLERNVAIHKHGAYTAHLTMLRESIQRDAFSVQRLWGNILPVDREDAVDTLVRCWHGIPLWDIVRWMPAVAKLSSWDRLIRAHDAIDTVQEAPF